MARTAKYSDDLLLDAVIQYSEICRTKIKATELAEWARKNIAGLEDVNDYNFTRPIKNPKSGKLEKKLCTQRMEEINVSRDTRKRESRNILLSSVNIDQFYDLSEREQRTCIAQARDIVAEYRQTNSYLRKKIDYLNSIQNDYADKIEDLKKGIKAVKSKQKNLDRMLSKIRRDNTEEQLRNKLAEMGITDGSFDLNRYNESLKLEMEDVFEIEKAIKEYQHNYTGHETSEDRDDNSTNDKKDFLDELTDF